MGERGGMAEERGAVPAFASEAEEKVFGEAHDSSEAVDWSRVRLARLGAADRHGVTERGKGPE